jgi:DNA repair protein RadC
MRLRLLARPTALADYEILEMLLFLGIPRRDTKPQAKGLINRFGSLAGVLGANPAALAGAGLPPRAVDAFAVVTEAAHALAQAELIERVVLSDWDALDRYLDAPARTARPPGLAALLLNNRNQLLGECAFAAADDVADVTRTLLRHALERHATAAIMLRNLGDAEPSASQADRGLLQHVRTMAAAVSVQVHDMVVLGQGGWISLRPGR